MSCNTTYDICVNQHSTYKLSVVVNDTGSIPLNLTSWYISGSIKEKYTSPIPTVSFGIEPIVLASGSFNLYLTPAQTALLTKAEYVYDVLAEVSGSTPPETIRLLEGVVAVNPGVTDGATY